MSPERMKTATQDNAATEARPPVTITIDGPAGAGKSSVARQLARRLGLHFLDTGAMYRAIALIAIEQGIALDEAMTNESRLVEAVHRSNLRFDWSADPPRVLIDWPTYDDLTERIRDADVTRAVSIVARMPRVRDAMVDRQRRVRDAYPRLVTEGRDQGSVVFPDAEVILYLDASPEVRAKRRAKQMLESGRAAEVSEADVLADIVLRDEMDRTRSDGPLVQPPNAIVVDTTSMSEREVVDHLERIVRSAVGSDVAASLKPPADVSETIAEGGNRKDDEGAGDGDGDDEGGAAR